MLLLFLGVFSLDTAGRVGDGAQTLFGNQFAGLAADPVGLVLNAYESVLQVLDELHLTLCELAGLLF